MQSCSRNIVRACVSRGYVGTEEPGESHQPTPPTSDSTPNRWFSFLILTSDSNSNPVNHVPEGTLDLVTHLCG
jgi:hypothetical protein